MRSLHIGFVGTRFGGLDGVSLESLKVAEVLRSLGHTVSWFAGEIGGEFTPARLVPNAHFDAPGNAELNASVFGGTDAPPQAIEEIELRAGILYDALTAYVADFEPDVLMPQNALAIPMSLPLGLAIRRFAHNTGIGVLAHHHDFAWERERFWPNAVGAILDEAFPPVSPTMHHLVINSLARDELQTRKGVSAHLLPNIMDFDQPPEPGDGAVFRSAAGLADTDVLLLQPTRMIPRKGIEDTLELARRLNDGTVRVVATHPEPDEGVAYVRQLEALADDLRVDFRIVPVGPGTRVALEDAYAAANLVCYPSRIEGFGNALLEAFYFRRPVVVNRYPVYQADIGPTGVVAIEMDGAVTDEVVDCAARWLGDPSEWAVAVEANYEIGRRHYSYSAAADVLSAALQAMHDQDRIQPSNR